MSWLGLVATGGFGEASDDDGDRDEFDAGTKIKKIKKNHL